MATRIEPLGRHDRQAFSCGEPSLDDWFKHRASQDARRNLAQVFVAVEDQFGRLGRDVRVRGQRVGDLLLADAIARVLDARERLGIFAIVVDALSEKARTFYKSFGFIPLPTRPDRLFLLTSVAERGRMAAAGRAPDDP